MSLLFVLTTLVLQDATISVAVAPAVVDVGDVIEVTVDVTSSDRDVVAFAEQPRFDGFSTIGMTRNSAVNYEGAVGVRTTTWSIELRATSPGGWSVGRVRVTVGDAVLESSPLSVSVRESATVGEEALANRLRMLVNGAPGPDGTDQVIVSVVASHDTLVLGEQLDLLVVAWFPRDVRTRLRTRPTLSPPDMTGAWTYEQTAALGVLSSRDVGGRAYDMFVHHQVVFPLTPGTFAIGSAGVSYNLPVRTSILSREIPQEIQSNPFEVTVVPRPNGAAGDLGLAAGDLVLALQVDTARFAEGEAATVTASVTGRGNVSLWPEPEFSWPPGLRVYAGQTEIELTGDSGMVRGQKTFTYLVVADSAGAYAVPETAVDYYDLDRQRAGVARFPAVRLVSRVGAPAAMAGRGLPALVAVRGLPWAAAVVSRMSLWWWIVIGLVPPLFVAVVTMVRRRPPPLPFVPRAAAQTNEIHRLDVAFRTALSALVPDVAVREGGRLTAALEAAGVESPVAAHAGRVRDRLRRAVYGPDGAADQDELAEEVREVLNALPQARSQRMTVLPGLATGVMLVLACVSSGQAQSPSAEQLFRAGGFRQAADSFAARAAADPGEPAHWINLGNAWRAGGDDTRARVAWLRAARLVPRNGGVRRAISETGVMDLETRRLTRVFPVTVPEALVVAVVVWLTGWLGMGLRWWKRPYVAAVLTGGVLAYAYYVSRDYQRDVAVVVSVTAPLRTAPHPSATPAAVANQGAAVLVRAREGGWLRVDRGASAGWVLAENVSPI